MAEINLLAKYPQSKRNLTARAQEKSDEIRSVAKKFGQEYFDGDRLYGYGGYTYHPRFWQDVVKDFRQYYSLTSESSILDVGCGKGFMMHDFALLLYGGQPVEKYEQITHLNSVKQIHGIYGIDISQYAIDHALDDMKPFLTVANANALPFSDYSFDLVISINTVHNLPLNDCKNAIREIQRVSKGKAFITVDAYRNDEEKNRMDDWNLTAQTYMSVEEWKKLFDEVGYTGDYYWFIP